MAHQAWHVRFGTSQGGHREVNGLAHQVWHVRFGTLQGGPREVTGLARRLGTSAWHVAGRSQAAGMEPLHSLDMYYKTRVRKNAVDDAGSITGKRLPCAAAGVARRSPPSAAVASPSAAAAAAGSQSSWAPALARNAWWPGVRAWRMLPVTSSNALLSLVS